MKKARKYPDSEEKMRERKSGEKNREKINIV